MPLCRGSTHDDLMLTEDDVADVEGDAEAFREELGGDEWTTIVELCERATGVEPELVDEGPEGRLRYGVVQLRRGLSEARQRQRVGHELGHLFYERIEHSSGPRLEAMCDLFGAVLCMPRWAVMRALCDVGHRVHTIAGHFGVTQSVALLRVGEVTRRPVLLLREAGPIARGAAFGWPSTSAVVRALAAGRSTVHPIRINDEPNRCGLMASRAAWAALCA
jgi:hypothetical protein